MKNGILKDARYPRCSKLGVLRKRVWGGTERLIVSTSALYEAVGHAKYQNYLPLITYKNAGGPTPESCEKFLETL